MQQPDVHDQLVVGQLGGSAAAPLFSSDTNFAHPSFGRPGGARVVLFDEQTSIAFRPLDTLTGFRGEPVLLPPIVNTPSVGEYAPAFTPDGRYVAFLRRSSGVTGNDHLFVWDSQTQTILNPSGVAVGTSASNNVNDVSLYTRPTFQSTSVSLAGRVTFNVLQPTSVGLLVQRVTGHHRLFGRSVPTLKAVGRVPLGKFKKGSRKTHWNLRVGGRPLHRGT